MFNEFKQKIVRDYTVLTIFLLLCVSLSIYFVSSYISYKDQISRLKMLAVEESEELFYKMNSMNGIKDFTLDESLPSTEDSYFNRMFVYGYTQEHLLLLKHNEITWSQSFMENAIRNDLFNYNQVYWKFVLLENRHPKLFMIMRYPLIEDDLQLGEIYVGIEVTHWARETVRIFFILILIILLSMFFVRYIANRMANKAMVPVIKSFEQQKQFVANASHELRTPLSIIISGMTILKSDEDNKLTDFSKEVITDMNDESLKMKKLIDNLLLTARNDNDTLIVNPVTFSLRDLLVKLYNKFSLLADKKNITIDMAEIKDISVYADCMHIEQILAILIDNAIKYTAENGKISIKLQEEKEKIVVSVADNGKGISSEDLPHIFERFYRADKSRTNYGNGLGLSIAKMLAEKNHSYITVTSEENIGSCFSLVIENAYF